MPALGIVAGLAALLVFALLLGAGDIRTAASPPSRLFITERSRGQVLMLDPATGAQLAAAALGETPAAIVYDAERAQLYVALPHAIAALDPATLAVRWRWQAPQEISSNANIALQAAGGRLYLPQPSGVIALDVSRDAPAVAHVFALNARPQALALTPNGATLLALAPTEARLWSINTGEGTASSQQLAQPDATRSGWLALSPDGATSYALLTRVGSAATPTVWQINQRDGASTTLALGSAPAPWDFALLGGGLLAVPRGNGTRGGIELLSTAPLSQSAQLDASYDQHHIVVGANGELFGLNFSHGTVTRYDVAGRAVAWRTPADTGISPWDGVLVP
ncbi:hypothetical protein SE17_16780 [Kouleothrix aurantiaca]|uniref:Uncharacterized protein n=1 Tax=Kouleothrix aurantiaca TaxID=186479 RepID=A0A0P9D9M4_9CHLR|nr:hypothetical protein SE17_16780 [Kouleothrix aurantiaca]